MTAKIVKKFLVMEMEFNIKTIAIVFDHFLEEIVNSNLIQIIVITKDIKFLKQFLLKRILLPF